MDAFAGLASGGTIRVEIPPWWIMDYTNYPEVPHTEYNRLLYSFMAHASWLRMCNSQTIQRKHISLKSIGDFASPLFNEIRIVARPEFLFPCLCFPWITYLDFVAHGYTANINRPTEYPTVFHHRYVHLQNRRMTTSRTFFLRMDPQIPSSIIGNSGLREEAIIRRQDSSIYEDLRWAMERNYRIWYTWSVKMESAAQESVRVFKGWKTPERFLEDIISW